jgi:hypothetical protein
MAAEAAPKTAHCHVGKGGCPGHAFIIGQLES